MYFVECEPSASCYIVVAATFRLPKISSTTNRTKERA